MVTGITSGHLRTAAASVLVSIIDTKFNIEMRDGEQMPKYLQLIMFESMGIETNAT